MDLKFATKIGKKKETLHLQTLQKCYIGLMIDFGSISTFISSLITSAKTSVSTCSRRPSMIFTLESTKITWQSSDPQKPTTHYTVFHSPSLWVKHVMNIAVISLVASKNMQGFRLISEGIGIYHKYMYKKTWCISQSLFHLRGQY